LWSRSGSDAIRLAPGAKTREGAMPVYSRILLTAALAAAFVIPSVEATMAKPAAKVFYAEQSVKTKACYAVTFKPNGKTATMIGTDSFASLSKALAAIKADADCKAPHMAKAKMPKAKTK